MANLIGQSLGQYEIIALLGKGGMATVYRARQASINRDVAVKVMRPDLGEAEDFIKRFEREAQTVASLSHPHILKVFDYGKTESLVYLVMELIIGGSLNDLIREGPMPSEAINRLLEQIGGALDYAHLRGVVHRDLKPQNVLLDENQNALLTDFGIAKLVKETTSLTHSGMALGTPAYMAPEQWRGEAVDARTDLYALGVILFEMLTGQLPFVGDTPYSMMHMHVFQAPPPIRSLKPDVLPGVERVMDKALAKDRDQRFQTAVELAAAFKSAAAGGMPVPLLSTRPGLPEMDFDKTIPESESPVQRPTQPRPPAAPIVSTPIPPAHSAQAAQYYPAQVNNTPTPPKGIKTSTPPPIQIPRPTARRPNPALIGFGIGALGMVILLILLGIVLLYISTRRSPGDIEMTQTQLALVPTQGGPTKVATLVQPSITSIPNVTPTFAPPTSTPNDALTALAKTQDAIAAVTRTPIPTNTFIPPSNTAVPIPPTDTLIPPTWTPIPATETPIMIVTPTSAVPTAVGGGKGMVAYVSDRDGHPEVWAIDVATRQENRLTSGGAGLPSWSPDGNTLSFDTDRSGNKELYSQSVDGSNQRNLSNNGGADWLASWSPDGTMIVFTSERDGNREIYLMSADGSNQRRITSTPAEDWLPVWSPNGQYIAFTSGRDGNSEIYVMNADGSNQVRITSSGATDFGSTWSPDSQQIAFVSERDGNREIYTINIDGSNARRLTNDPAEERFPAWSPDGTLIAFDSNRGGTYAIYTVSPSGSNLQQLTGNGSNNFGAAWRPSGIFSGGIVPTVVGFPTLIAVSNCPGFLPSRLTAGGQGRVSPGLPNRVRGEPSLTAQFLGQIPEGGVFSILDGPRCSPNMAWWHVNYNGLIGWTPEGDTDTYWLEPLG